MRTSLFPLPLVVFLAVFLVGATALGGCASQMQLAKDHDSLKNEISAAQTKSLCAPADLARAQANLSFAELEFQQGNTRRAQNHLDLGHEYAKIAGACGDKVIKPSKPVVNDADVDGVADEDDRCPRDMEDLDGFKDADGCPDLDDDGDGFYDTQDTCPRDAEDIDGYQDQDGCPDSDNDKDGIADGNDLCPNEAGAQVDRGCPIKDADNDGVMDNIDKCPTDAESKNDYLDEDGCPDNKPSRIEVTADQIVIKQRINFATGKAKILPDSYPVLDDVAQALRDYPNIKVEIGGHTDNVGDDAVNQRLSKSRADAVFEYLLSKGVAPTRMMTIGYGETKPLDTNRTEDGRLNNRRVEFVIIGAQLSAPAGQEAPASPWGQ